MMKKVMLLSMIAILCAGSVYALPDPVGHWPLDGDASDISGNGYDGTPSGTYSFGAGVYGDALVLDGGTANGWVDVPVEAWNDNLPGVDGYTVCFWAYTEDEVQESVPMTVRNGLRFFSVHTPWNGTIYYDTGNSGAGNGRQRVQVDGTSAQWDGLWSHWTFRYTPGSQEIILNGNYGAPLASGTGTAAIEAGATSFLIGSDDDHTETYIGTLDDVRLYNVALTDEEIDEVIAGGGLSGGGKAHTPDPAGPLVLSTEVPGYAASGVTWQAPLTKSDPNGDPNLVSVNGYDVYWSAGVEPNYLIATPVADYNYLATGESYTPTPPITYDTTYYWRVDTYVTWDSNDFTGTASFDSIVEGSEWEFTSEPAYTPVVLDSFANVITTVDIGTADLVAEISGNSTPVTAEFEILTDDIEYPAGSDAVLSNVGPSASLETTLTTSVAGTYKVRATVTDSPSTPPAAVDSAIAEVVVYADACEAKKDSPGGWDPNYYDQDDDCDVDVDDLGVYARSWLDDTTLAAPESYSGGTNYGAIVIEGEHYDVFPDPNDPNNIRPDQVSGAIYELTIDAENASNGEYMYIGSNGNYSNFDQNVLDNAPRMNYTVNIETAGTYQIWIRGHSDNGNSFHFGVDGAISQNALGQDLRVTGNPSWTWWHNIQGGATADIELTAGEHTINIYQRESPCGLDKILLSPDPDYVPTGMGPAETE